MCIPTDIKEAIAEKEREERVELRREKLFDDPDIIWEAASIESIRYPAKINNIASYTERRIAEADYDNYLAGVIASWVKKKDYVSLGKFFGENIECYVNNLAEDI